MPANLPEVVWRPAVSSIQHSTAAVSRMQIVLKRGHVDWLSGKTVTVTLLLRITLWHTSDSFTTLREPVRMELGAADCWTMSDSLVFIVDATCVADMTLCWATCRFVAA